MSTKESVVLRKRRMKLEKAFKARCKKYGNSFGFNSGEIKRARKLILEESLKVDKLISESVK